MAPKFDPNEVKAHAELATPASSPASCHSAREVVFLRQYGGEQARPRLGTWVKICAAPDRGDQDGKLCRLERASQQTCWSPGRHHLLCWRQR